MIDPIIRALIDEREARGWTRGKVAGLAGVSESTISKLERGDNGPTLDTLRAWADALDCDLTLTPRPRRRRR